MLTQSPQYITRNLPEFGNVLMNMLINWGKIILRGKVEKQLTAALSCHRSKLTNNCSEEQSNVVDPQVLDIAISP